MKQMTVGRYVIKWRWLPIIQYRYLPRAWQGTAPAGYVASWDWTGRDREVTGWYWPFAVERAAPAGYVELVAEQAPKWSWE